MIATPGRIGNPWTKTDLGVLVALAAFGATKLLLPLGGDQALFVIGGRELVEGGGLYDEVWDVKQPAIYWFAAVSAAGFGRSALAYNSLGLVWQLCFAVVLQRTLATRVDRRWVASVSPLLIVGPYVVGAGVFHANQVEALVMFPMYLSMWWAASADGGRREWVLAGIAAAVVALFKLIYLPVPLVAWIVLTWGRRGGVRSVLTASLVVAAVGGMVVIGFAATGVLGELRRILVEVTPEATSIAPRPLDRLVDGAAASVRFFPLVTALAVLGLVLRPRFVDPLERMALAAAIVGIPLFLVQHWWAYLLVWFLLPVGLLAVFALDRHAARLRTPIGLGLALVLLLPLGAANLELVRAAAANDLGLTPAGREAIHAELEPAYGKARAIALELTEPGDVYVLGNPIVYLESDRDEAIGINGWSPEQYPESVWEDIVTQLEAAKPTYVVVQDEIFMEFAPRTPGAAFGAWLADGPYCQTATTAGSVIFTRVDHGSCK